MSIDPKELEGFKQICQKICINIPPECVWHWDEKYNMAVIVLEESDAELVFFPLFKEFKNHWNFSSIGDADDAVNDYVHSKFGIMPGQALFTSHIIHDLILSVAWWPWGNDDRFSMRVGLIPIKAGLGKHFAYQCLSRWLNISSVADQI